MKFNEIFAAILLATFPSFATALTTEELVASLDENQAKKFQNIDADQHEWITKLLAPAFLLEDEENRFFIVDEVLLLFTVYSEKLAKNVFDEFEYAGIALTIEQREAIEELIAEKNLELTRQIIETRASSDVSRAELARLQATNSAKEQQIQELQDELTALRDEETALRDEEARLRNVSSEAQAREAALIQEIAYINAAIIETQATIRLIEDQ